jgi:hypothetical protein
MSVILWIYAALSILPGLFIKAGKVPVMITGGRPGPGEERERAAGKALAKSIGGLSIRLAFGLAWRASGRALK